MKYEQYLINTHLILFQNTSQEIKSKALKSLNSLFEMDTTLLEIVKNVENLNNNSLYVSVSYIVNIYTKLIMMVTLECLYSHAYILNFIYYLFISITYSYYYKIFILYTFDYIFT